MADPHGEDEAAAEAARARLLQAVDDAIEATRGIADPDRAFAAAKLLVELLRAATNQAGTMHAGYAAHIRDMAGLTYAKLGDRLGVGTTRAYQLCERAARDAERAAAVADAAP